jgi:phosphoglucomutase
MPACVMDRLRSLSDELSGQNFGEYTVKHCDDFSYTDVIDNSVSSHQGVRILFTSGARIVYRLSGTGTEGATLRVYIEQTISGNEGFNQDPQQLLSKLIKISSTIAAIEKHTGRKAPDVIT